MGLGKCAKVRSIRVILGKEGVGLHREENMNLESEGVLLHREENMNLEGEDV